MPVLGGEGGGGARPPCLGVYSVPCGECWRFGKHHTYACAGACFSQGCLEVLG